MFRREEISAGDRRFVVVVVGVVVVVVVNIVVVVVVGVVVVIVVVGETLSMEDNSLVRSRLTTEDIPSSVSVGVVVGTTGLVVISVDVEIGSVSSCR